jgi:ATP-binding cassette subfamily C (CFTR/MRP) protein 1
MIIPINIVGGHFAKKWQVEQMDAKDKRIKLMNEVVAGMKVLKLYAWEIPFKDRINKIRGTEIRVLQKMAWFHGVLTSSFTITPVFVILAVFAVFVAMDPVNNILTADKVFVSIALMNLIRLPMIMFPYALMESVKLVISINRLNRFLIAEELDTETVQGELESRANAIEMKSAHYTWSSDEEHSAIKDINLEVKKGSLVAVVGSVGSGKSSLLSAMLGEMERVSGSIAMEGKVAYVPQSAWIQNMELKDNILFHNPYVQQDYEKVLDACALRDDLAILTAGDGTEIGENGINLSGGQKSRVSLARAVYSNADVYLFDDPLSAVDAHVGQHIFERVMSEDGCLRGKTRVLVTHGVTYLPKTDKIFVMKDGVLAESGTYRELVDSKGAFSEFLSQYQTESSSTNNDEKAKEEERVTMARQASLKSQLSVEEEEHAEDDGKLVKAEEAAIGEVKWSLFKKYFKTIGYLTCLKLLILYAAGQSFRAGGSYWLSLMSDENDESGNNSETVFYLGIYLGFGLAESINELYREISAYQAGASASETIHKNVLFRVMRGPMSFFGEFRFGILFHCVLHFI